MTRKAPETLQEAIEYARKYQQEHGVGIETVPNPKKGVFFNVIERTVTALEWDEDNNMVEIVHSGDTGEELKRRIVDPLSEKKDEDDEDSDD